MVSKKRAALRKEYAKKRKAGKVPQGRLKGKRGSISTRKPKRKRGTKG